MCIKQEKKHLITVRAPVLTDTVDNCVAINKTTPCLGAGTWKTDASLLHKLRQRCRYLGAAGVGNGSASTRATSILPPQDVQPLADDDHLPLSEGHTAVDRTFSASSPPSPLPARAASSSPPKLSARVRSMLVARDLADRKRTELAAGLDLGTVRGRDITLSTSLRKLAVDDGGLDAAGFRSGVRQRTTMSALLRHTCDLLVSSGVRPELLVELLRRRDVVGDETVAAVGRCVARRQAACELIAEVVASKAEVAALCDGLRATECGDVADCLAAVDSLLRLHCSDSVSSDSLSTASIHDRFLQ